MIWANFWNLLQALLISALRQFISDPLFIVAILFVGLVVACLFRPHQARSALKACLISSLVALVFGIMAVEYYYKTHYVGHNDGALLGSLLTAPVGDDYVPTLFVDALSCIFLLLTLFIFPFCFVTLRSLPWYRHSKYFCIALMSMEILLVLTFTTNDLLYFYVFFESLLIPMFILIGIWGARERKVKAAYYFFLYTLFGSLIMLFGIIYVYSCVGSTKYSEILKFAFTAEQQQLIWICFFLAFAVKMPMFPLHIWLPEAHVEAPTVGSMLLASLLLKLGGYGFIRFSIALFPLGSAYFLPLVSTMGVLGVLYGSLSTIRQIDMKRVVAYSSVAHMNLVVLGLFSNTEVGISGAIYLMIAHGVVSTALFFCVGVLYDRYHTRLLRYYGGLVTVMPLFCSAFFAFTLANMSFPGTSNFPGEFFVFLGIFSTNTTTFLLSATSIVLSAIYSIWLYNRVAFGTLKTKYIDRFSDLTLTEASVLIALTIPMLVLGVSANIVLIFTDIAVNDIFYFQTY